MSAKGKQPAKKRRGTPLSKAFDREKTLWEAEVLENSLSSHPELKQKYVSGSGEIEINRLYSPKDIEVLDYVNDLGFPGKFPFTRGIEPCGLRAREWPQYFYTGFGTGESANERLKTLIRAGGNHLQIALDLPTQIGLDSDHPMAQGEVGKVGVALDTLDDLVRLFEGISLDNISIGTVGNCIGPWAVAMFCALAENKGLPYNRLKGKIQNDPFKEYSGRGTYIFPVDVAVDLASDTVAYCLTHLPAFRDLQWACTTTIRWGGGNASQEIGFGIANLITYVEAALKKGVRIEEVMPRLNIHATADNDLFEEVAKFRAMRRLWAKIARERFKTDDPRVLGLKITVFTNGTRLTSVDPMNNIIRTTMQVLAASLGGVQWITIPAHDEALALPTFESTRLAGLTKNILTEENLVGNTVDPLGGSYYVEALTNELEDKGRKWYEKVEAMGGSIQAIASGFYLSEMARGMHQYQQEIESGQRTLIGVNKFTLDKDESVIKLFKPDPEDQKRQIGRLNDVKKRRSEYSVHNALGEIRRTAEEKARGRMINIIPPILDAVKEDATVGEIFAVLRDVFGEYQPSRKF
jgi:methylmalonyl-CoA mutase N-terminal domain/subunit